MTITLCRCGAARDERGLCPHCDAPPAVKTQSVVLGSLVTTHKCPENCARCAERDRWCVVCKKPRQSKPAAELCETQDRRHGRAA